MRTSYKIKFLPNEQEDAFGSVLRNRVNDYFETERISKKFNSLMLFKSFVYLAAYATTYFAILSGHFSFPSMIVLWMFIGALTAGIGFNIGHDANHGAYSTHEWLNNLMGGSFLLLGADTFSWKTLHNTVHHSYTNIAEADGDLHPVGFLRFHKSNPKKSYHRFQHFYAPILYGLTSLVWVFRKDYQQMLRKQHLIYELPEPTRLQIFNLFFFKAIYYTAFLVVPFIVLTNPWWQILLGFLAMHFVAGFSLAIVFQLGHLVEGPDFPELSADHSVTGSWFSHQLCTASNFSTKSYMAEWLFGGLNFQIEHHLFPKICHVHYRKIAPIVKQTAQEFGLPYYERPGFFNALRSHLKVLKKLGV